MMPTINEIVVDIQSEKPRGSKNRIQSKLSATRNTTPINIRSNKLVFIGRKPLRGLLFLLIIFLITPLPHQRLIQLQYTSEQKIGK